MSPSQPRLRSASHRTAVMPVRRWLERPAVVLSTAAILFAAIFALALGKESNNDALSLLYVIPIALIALELGLRAGLAAAALGVALLAVRWIVEHPGISALGFATRALPMICVGGLVGQFSDRVRSALARQEGLLETGLDLARLGDLAHLPGTLAEHAVELVEAAGVRVNLIGAPSVERGDLSAGATTIPIASRGIRFGELEVSAGPGRRFDPEAHLTLSMLALQAAVAADNQRLLEGERERAALHSELERTRQRLSDQLRNAGQVLDRQEEERREIGRQLHEQVAQTLAAALIAVSLLDDGPGGSLGAGQLEEARRHMQASLADLRRLAGSLRPAVLDELGLVAALERLAASKDGQAPIALTVDERVEALPEWAQTSAHRTVEEALSLLDGVREVSVAPTGADSDLLRIEIRAETDGETAESDGRLLPLRARLELMGGTLRTEPDGDVLTVIAKLPLRN